MIYYVKALGLEEREDLRVRLINSGYTLGDKQDNERYFSTDLPVWVDLEKEAYGVVGNVTCAAAAASQDLLISCQDFMTIFKEHQLKVHPIVPRQPVKNIDDPATDQLVNDLIRKWKEKYSEAYEEWEKKPLWYAKYVSTKFIINGIEKSLVAKTFGWSDGFFESVQGEIEAELVKHGAVITYSGGMMD